jgi:DNA-binding MarR family transcriptional regulator
VGSIVDALEGAGYVERIPDPADGRARLVAVTAKGQNLVELSIPEIREIETAWESEVGQARLRELRRTLTALRDRTDPYRHPHN